MNNKVELQKLVEHFDANIDFYKDANCKCKLDTRTVKIS